MPLTSPTSPLRSQLPMLQNLFLASNRLTSMKGLPQIRSLRTLDLSGNTIPSLDGIPELPQVRCLWVGWWRGRAVVVT